jgi:hypothetical protein
VPSEKPRRWATHLSDSDLKEIRAWVESSGPERVARIIAVLAVPQRGHPTHPDPDLMRKMAELKRADRERSNHSIAVQVASEAVATRRARASFENLRDRLYDRFNAEQRKWEIVVTSKAEKLPGDVKNAPLAASEARVLSRLIEILPTGRFRSFRQR